MTNPEARDTLSPKETTQSPDGTDSKFSALDLLKGANPGASRTQDSNPTGMGESAATAIGKSNRALEGSAASRAEALGSAVAKAATESLINQAGSEGSLKQAERSRIDFGTENIDSFFKVTDKDREKAKKALGDNELLNLVPKEDRATLKSMESALIDGNLEALKGTLKKLSDNPQKLKQFVDIVNKVFDKHEHTGGIQLGMDNKGNVLVYKEFGNTAVSINPKDGTTTLRAVEQQADGSVLLKPGEIINREPDDVMHTLGDAATRSINFPVFRPLEPIAPVIRPYGPYNFKTEMPNRINELLKQQGAASFGASGETQWIGSQPHDSSPLYKDKRSR